MWAKMRAPSPQPVNHELNRALGERQELLDRKDRVLESFRKAQSTLKQKPSGRRTP